MYTCIKCKQLVLDLFVKHTPKCYISDGLILLKVGFFRISKLVTSFSICLFCIGVEHFAVLKTLPLKCSVRGVDGG